LQELAAQPQAAVAPQRPAAEAPAFVPKKDGRAPLNTSIDLSSPQPSKQNAKGNNNGKKGQ
jgi:hypothetical protein